MAEATFTHGVSWPDNKGITLSDVAATLLAQEKLIPLAVEILTDLYPGLKIDKVTIDIDFIKHGSLSENFFVAILLVYQKDFDRAVPQMVEYLTGARIPDDLKPIISVLFIMLIYTGARYLLDRGGKPKGKGGAAGDAYPHITGDYNTYINLAASRLDVPEGELERAVTRVAAPKRRGMLARAAVDMFRPAKRGEPGRVIVDGVPPISSETVSEFPSDIALAEFEDDTEIERFDDALLEIRATDRDKADTGWAGRLVSGAMSTKRLGLKLYPTVDRDALAAVTRARVEALVESRPQGDGTAKALRIHVLRVIDPPPRTITGKYDDWSD